MVGSEGSLLEEEGGEGGGKVEGVFTTWPRKDVPVAGFWVRYTPERAIRNAVRGTRNEKEEGMVRSFALWGALEREVCGVLGRRWGLAWALTAAEV